MGAKDGRFPIKRLYSELKPKRYMNFPSKMIWNSWVPPKVEIFAWEATWSKILTLDNIQRRGWTVTNRCYLCGKEEKSTGNILIHCDMTCIGVLFALVSFFDQYILSYLSKKKTRVLCSSTDCCLYYTYMHTHIHIKTTCPMKGTSLNLGSILIDLQLF